MVSYSIAEVADRTGLTAHTLRYYERDDLLLRPVARDSGGRRVYDDEDLGWIRMLTCLRATGMPIREITAPPSWRSSRRCRSTWGRSRRRSTSTGP